MGCGAVTPKRSQQDSHLRQIAHSAFLRVCPSETDTVPPLPSGGQEAPDTGLITSGRRVLAATGMGRDVETLSSVKPLFPHL